MEAKKENALGSGLLMVQSKLKAHKGQVNSFGNYRYRSCEDILEALKPLLAEASMILMLTDTIEFIGDRYYVKAEAKVMGMDGFAITVTAFAREPLAKKGMDESQITGAASSYARKYALNGLFAIDDTKDADTLPPPAGGDNKTVKPQPKAETKPDTKSAPKGVIVPEPSPESLEILRHAFTAYLINRKGDLINNFEYNFDMFKAAIIDKYHKYPTNPNSVKAIVAAIDPIDVMRDAS